MRELPDVLDAVKGPRAERVAAQRAFLARRTAIWRSIEEGTFPARYVSSGARKFSGAPARTAIRCDFLLASRIALGRAYRTDRIADRAQRDLLFHVLRDRETFPKRTGARFYCCAQCTSKLHESVSAGVFRYIDNAKWEAAIESGRATSTQNPRAR